MSSLMTLGTLLTIVGVALLILAYTVAAPEVPTAVGVILTAVGLTVATIAAVTKA